MHQCVWTKKTRMRPGHGHCKRKVASMPSPGEEPVRMYLFSWIDTTLDTTHTIYNRAHWLKVNP